MIAIGPVVAETSRAFDVYWNDKASVPVKAFDTTNADGSDVDHWRERLQSEARELSQSDYASVLIDALPGGRNINHGRTVVLGCRRASSPTIRKKWTTKKTIRRCCSRRSSTA